MRPSRNHLWLAVPLALGLWGPACRSGRSGRPVPTEADLRPYDFRGHDCEPGIQISRTLDVDAALMLL